MKLHVRSAEAKEATPLTTPHARGEIQAGQRGRSTPCSPTALRAGREPLEHLSSGGNIYAWVSLGAWYEHVNPPGYEISWIPLLDSRPFCRRQQNGPPRLGQPARGARYEARAACEMAERRVSDHFAGIGKTIPKP